MQITFNTGRQYTQRGQIITAKFDPATGTVWFNDHSRMVDGSFFVEGPFATRSLLWKNNPESFAKAVMRRYDAGGTSTNGSVEDWKIARDLREGDTILQYRI
jgi:hypothetical protein